MKKHALMMILCCAIPIALLLFLSGSNLVGSWGYLAIFLLCPLMHLLMPHHNHNDKNSEKGSKSQETKCH